MNIGKLVNAIIFCVGIILIIVSFIINGNTNGISELKTILISIGTSIVATAIVTFLTSHYIISTSNSKKIIEEWNFKSIYQTRAEMNTVSNQYLDKCHKNIDIIATGMSNYLNAKGKQLEKN